jgi:thiol-disulfide isomerase/thioredoxin
MTWDSGKFRIAGGRVATAFGGLVMFAIGLQAVTYLRRYPIEPLIPIDQRQAGAVMLPVLNMSPAATVTAGSATAGAGLTWSLSEQAGKVVVLNYFATWCGPCVAESPELVRLATEYAPRGVEFAGISLDRDSDLPAGITSEEAVRAFVRREHIPYPVLIPPNESVLWKIGFPVPQTFIYDRHGRKAKMFIGQIDETALRHWLDELLRESS